MNHIKQKQKKHSTTRKDHTSSSDTDSTSDTDDEEDEEDEEFTPSACTPVSVTQRHSSTTSSSSTVQVTLTQEQYLLFLEAQKSQQPGRRSR